MPGKINYSKRDFLALKNEQINYIKQYYPNLIQNYNADKTYYLVNRRFVKIQRSVIPFVYDTTVLKEFPKSYVSMK